MPLVDGAFLGSTRILIPLEVDRENFVTGIFALENDQVPEGGQRNILDHSGVRFQENLAGLTVHENLKNRSMQEGYTATLMRIARSIDQCEEHTWCHGIRTGLWARHLAMEIGLSTGEVEAIALAGKLHDIGKVFIPSETLTRPTRLAKEEWTLVQKHPTWGGLVMKPATCLHPLIPFVEAHHEHYDGSGYPYRLSGEIIPLGARIISVADAFATITEGRIYKKPASNLDAMGEIIRWSGRQFDPMVVEALVSLVEKGLVHDWVNRS